MNMGQQSGYIGNLVYLKVYLLLSKYNPISFSVEICSNRKPSFR